MGSHNLCAAHKPSAIKATQHYKAVSINSSCWPRMRLPTPCGSSPPAHLFYPDASPAAGRTAQVHTMTGDQPSQKTWSRLLYHNANKHSATQDVTVYHCCCCCCCCGLPMRPNCPSCWSCTGSPAPAAPPTGMYCTPPAKATGLLAAAAAAGAADGGAGGAGAADGGGWW